MRSAVCCVFAAAISSVALGAPMEQAETGLDLALVIAVDVSSSIDPAERKFQRNGFVEAFRSSLVHQAIRRGAAGRIAVAYVEWSGKDEQRIVVPWTVLDGPERANAFSDRLTSQPFSRGGFTSISGVIDFSTTLLAQTASHAARQVIDVSGDGPNNDGRIVTLARDAAVAAGITVNGLPILLDRPAGSLDIANLDLYFAECVVGGFGAFVAPVREHDQFPAVVRAKIAREIAETEPDARIVLATAAGTSCSIGEIRRQEEEAWK